MFRVVEYPTTGENILVGVIVFESASQREALMYLHAQLTLIDKLGGDYYYELTRPPRPGTGLFENL